MQATFRHRMPYNKQLTNRACSSRTGEYLPSVVAVGTSLHLVRTATTSGQYSRVRSSCSVSKRLIVYETQFITSASCDSKGRTITKLMRAGGGGGWGTKKNHARENLI